jgi:hypothetical protein
MTRADGGGGGGLCRGWRKSRRREASETRRPLLKKVRVVSPALVENRCIPSPRVRRWASEETGRARR